MTELEAIEFCKNDPTPLQKRDEEHKLVIKEKI